MAGKNFTEVILIIGDPHVGKTSSLGNFKIFNKVDIEKVSVFNFGGKRFKNSTFFGAYKMLNPLIYFVEIGGHVLDIVLEADKIQKDNDIAKAIKEIYKTIKDISVIIYVLPLYEVYRKKAIKRVLNHIKKIGEISENSNGRKIFKGRKYWILLFTYSEPYINNDIFIENPPNNGKELKDIVSLKINLEYEYTLDSIFSKPSPLIYEKYDKEIKKSKKISDLEEILKKLEKDVEEYKRQWHIYKILIKRKAKEVDKFFEKIDNSIKRILNSDSIREAEEIYSNMMTWLDLYRVSNLNTYGNQEKWKQNPEYKEYYEFFRKMYSQIENVIKIFFQLRIIKDEVSQYKGHLLQGEAAPEEIYVSEDLAKCLEGLVNEIRKNGQYVVGVYIITNDIASRQLLKEKKRLDKICFNAMLEKIKKLHENGIIRKVEIHEESFIGFFRKKIEIKDPQELKESIGWGSEVEKEFMKEFPEGSK